MMEGGFTYTGAFDDTLNGGDGFDQLYGGDGRDLFVFEATSAFNNVDEINDYSLGDGDTLDVADLLTGFTEGVSDINDFIQFVNSGSDTLVQIDVDGTVGGANFQNVAQINDINDLDATTLYNAGAIIV